ncbi:MAG: hypothetical protein M0Z85_02425 [Gammaproteobacteria bacterium]|nr:hypothetical protein [Gammaproteobacteria bacterium]
MKLNTEISTVQAKGVMEKSQARIKMSAHAFSILASGLYTDKIAAVLREVGCNARDAHVAAGKPDLPIEVKLPTVLDSQFHIKDWGVGLDKEEVMGMYLTFFESTKSESDDFVGAFGLGSKSPFAYTDSFTVTAAKGGVKRVFTVFREAGVPQCVFLHEEPAPADWQNGLQVSFPVKAADLATFAARAARVYEFWDVKPVFRGAEVTWPSYTARLETASCVLVRGTGQASSVVMGGVRYPLPDPSDIVKDTVSMSPGEAEFLLSFLRIFFGHYAPILKAPIGLLAVTPSREALSLDTATQKHLLSLAVRAGGEVCEVVQNALTRRPGETLWELVARADEALSAIGPALPLLRSFGALQGRTWSPGTDMESVLEQSINVDPECTRLSVLYRKNRRGQRKEWVDVLIGAQGYRVVPLSPKVRFIEDNTGRKTLGSRLAMQYANSNPDLIPVVVHPMSGHTTAEAREALGNPPDTQWLLATDLPRPPRKPRPVVAANGGQTTVAAKYAKGCVQAELYKWDAQDCRFVRDTSASRVALLDGTRWTLADEGQAISILGSPFVCRAVRCLSDAQRVAAGLDRVVVLAHVVYDRYRQHSELRRLEQCLTDVRELAEVRAELLPAALVCVERRVLMVAERHAPGNSWHQPTDSLLSSSAWETLRKLQKGSPHGYWLKSLLRLVSRMETRCGDDLVDVLERSKSLTRVDRLLLARVLPIDDVQGQYDKDDITDAASCPGVNAPTGNDWQAAIELAFNDDEPLMALANTVVVHAVGARKFPECVMDRSLGGIQAETLLGRLAAKDRQARGVELRKQRNAARKEQKARLIDPTLDMFADWVTHETRGETAGHQAA